MWLDDSQPLFLVVLGHSLPWRQHHPELCLVWIDPGFGHIPLGLAPLSPSQPLYLLSQGLPAFLPPVSGMEEWVARARSVVGGLCLQAATAEWQGGPFLLASCPQRDFKPCWSRGHPSIPYPFSTVRLRLFIAVAI